MIGMIGLVPKQKYMDGAVCMGRRISSEIEKLRESFQYLLEEYKRRVNLAIEAE